MAAGRWPPEPEAVISAHPWRPPEVLSAADARRTWRPELSEIKSHEVPCSPGASLKASVAIHDAKQGHGVPARVHLALAVVGPHDNWHFPPPPATLSPRSGPQSSLDVASFWRGAARPPSTMAGPGGHLPWTLANPAAQHQLPLPTSLNAFEPLLLQAMIEFHCMLHANHGFHCG